MNIKVFSRSRFGDIWDKMKEFIPPDIECVRITGYDHWTDALRYLLDLFDYDVDYIVNVDVDCFIYDWSKVMDIINQLENSSNVFAGMPDNYENHLHRFNRFEHTNPFFNVFKRKQCAEIVDGLTRKELRNCNHEPFDGLFVSLFNHGRIPLKGVMHADGMSTILENAMIHTWYSRDASHAQRIENRYLEAKELCKKGLL